MEQAVDDLQPKLDAEIARWPPPMRPARPSSRPSAPLYVARSGADRQQSRCRPDRGQPGPRPFQCPVQGAAYSDDYGGPTGHPGIDMFVPTGTTAVAVKAGDVTYVANEGAGGNTAYLAADDGNTYFYAHFSQFVGEARTVAKGEVIGLTGMTGNATAPHLHFEVRAGRRQRPDDRSVSRRSNLPGC